MQKVETQKSRIREVDILRGVGIISVIIGHSFIVHPINLNDIPWCDLVHRRIISSFHMELLFLVAGSVYHCINYRKFINKKIHRIVVPYLFFGLITLLLHSSDIGAVNKHYSFWDGILKLFFYGGSYWFLYVLFMIFLIYPLIEKFCRKPWMELLLAIGCIALSEFVMLPSIFKFDDVVYYLPYFIFGHLLVRFLSLDKIENDRLNIGLFAVSLLTYILLIMHTPAFKLTTRKYVVAMMMIFCLYVVAHYLLKWADSGSKIGKTIEKFFDNCSKYSLQLYLFNGFILVVARTLLVRYLHVTEPVIIVILITFFNLLITLLICNFVLTKTRWLAWICGTGERPWLQFNSSGLKQ